MAFTLSLSKQVTYGCISTSIGELYIFPISAENKSDLHKSLDGRIKECSPEKFVREFSRYVCYPKNSLLNGECKPKLVVLTGGDVRKLEQSDLDNISKLFIENNKYLYTGRVTKRSNNQEGQIVVPSEDGEFVMLKEDSESWTKYLYRLSLLEVEEQKKQYVKMTKSILGTLHSSQNLDDTITRTFSIRDSLSQTFQKIHNSYLLSPKDAIECVRKSLVPNLTVTDHMKAIQPQSSIAAIEEITKATQSLKNLSTLTDTINSIRQNERLTIYSTASELIAAMKQRENQLFSRFTHAEYYLEDLAKQRGQISTFINELHQDTFGNKAVQEMMLNQSAFFDRLYSRVALMDAAIFSISQFSQATMAWNIASSSLTSRMLEVGLLAQKERLSARLFEVPNTYAEFVRHTMDRLAADPTPEIAARLRGSLVLAEYQLLGIDDTFNAFIVVPDDDEKPDGKRILDVPFLQQTELLSCKYIEDENNTEALIANSPTAKIAEKAHRVLQLVALCNDAGKTSAFNAEFFKPTTRLLEVFIELTWISATDKRRFGEVVDCLYFIFYEGAGKDNLRYLDENGGPLTKTDCELIWCIKHLRNKWLRHDADHGSEKDIRKSWTELTEKFQWLGLASYPTDARHFQGLHYKLLELSEDFLLCILDRLKLR